MIEQLGHLGGHKSLKRRMNNQTVLHSNNLCCLSTEFQNLLKQQVKQPRGHYHKVKNEKTW